MVSKCSVLTATSLKSKRRSKRLEGYTVASYFKWDGYSCCASCNDDSVYTKCENKTMFVVCDICICGPTNRHSRRGRLLGMRLFQKASKTSAGYACQFAIG